MRTVNRLDKAYMNARVEYFDSLSNYVIISDCHRGDGGLSDEFTKNQNVYLYALYYYYKNGFTYVEAGDGDELWEHPKFKVIKDAHYDVYNRIKEFYDAGRYILLYGITTYILRIRNT